MQMSADNAWTNTNMVANATALANMNVTNRKLICSAGFLRICWCGDHSAWISRKAMHETLKHDSSVMSMHLRLLLIAEDGSKTSKKRTVKSLTTPTWIWDVLRCAAAFIFSCFGHAQCCHPLTLRVGAHCWSYWEDPAGAAHRSPGGLARNTGHKRVSLHTLANEQ